MIVYKNQLFFFKIIDGGYYMTSSRTNHGTFLINGVVAKIEQNPHGNELYVVPESGTPIEAFTKAMKKFGMRMTHNGKICEVHVLNGRATLFKESDSNLFQTLSQANYLQ
ncbi:MAG: hypothetical protein NUV82_04670 [Candidatus Komeilibacteria bacterium]|nr:hypothetical protein [Candidatus Komeilibacteria bacterium]